MSLAEADRLSVMQGLVGGQLCQREAAARLGVSVRHVKRLLKALSRGRRRGVDIEEARSSLEPEAAGRDA